MSGDRRARIAALLRAAPLFASLTEEEVAGLADFAELIDFRQGATVMRAGDDSDAFFIVASGEVVVTKEVASGQSITLASFVAGDCFGELDFFSRTPRDATAVADGDSVLLVFPGRSVPFDRLQTDHPRLFAKVLHAFLITVAQRIRATNRLITENAPWVKELKRQILTDAQTGLYTRTYLEQEAAGFLREPTALIMLKPDNFKQLNDRWGHQAGDGAMVLLAGMLPPHLGEGGFAVRYRSNELAVVLPGAEEVRARQAAEGLRQAVKALDLGSLTGGALFRFTASLAVAVHRGGAAGWQQAAAAVYELLYRARNDGGDRVYGPGEASRA